MEQIKFTDYNRLVKYMKNKERTKKVVDDYSMYYGSQDDISINDTPFYRDYLSKFEIPFCLVVPKNWEDCYDWHLVAKLVFGSFSSGYTIIEEKKQQLLPKKHLIITAESKGVRRTQDISEMQGIGVLSLLVAYVEEQMKWFSLMAEDKDGAEAIRLEQRVRLAYFKCKVVPGPKKPFPQPKLFDYNMFIKKMQKNEEKKYFLEEFTKCFGPQDEISIYDTPFYKDYLSKFEIPFSLSVPNYMEDVFDWDSLFRLVLGSFSLEYDLEFDGNSQPGTTKIRMKIRHIPEEANDVKNIESTDIYDMWCYKIYHLFEILVEEQMMSCPIKSSAQSEEDFKDDIDEINEMRWMRLHKYNLNMLQLGLDTL